MKSTSFLCQKKQRFKKYKGGRYCLAVTSGPLYSLSANPIRIVLKLLIYTFTRDKVTYFAAVAKFPIEMESRFQLFI